MPCVVPDLIFLSPVALSLSARFDVLQVVNCDPCGATLALSEMDCMHAAEQRQGTPCCFLLYCDWYRVQDVGGEWYAQHQGGA